MPRFPRQRPVEFSLLPEGQRPAATRAESLNRKFRKGSIPFCKVLPFWARLAVRLHLHAMSVDAELFEGSIHG